MKLPYEVRVTAEWQLRRYWQKNKELEKYKNDLIPSTTPKYGGTGGGKGESRPTERVSEMMLNDVYIQEIERAALRISSLLNKLSKDDMLIVELIYKKGWSCEAVAMHIHMDRATVFRHRAAILVETAKALGLIPASKD